MRQPLLTPASATLARGVGLLLLLSVLAGCGSGHGTVSGRVLYGKRLVTGGTVTFAPVEGGSPPVLAQIDENGRYEVTVPAKEMWISVDNQALKPPATTRDIISVPALKGVKLPPLEKGHAPEVAPGQEKPPGKYVPIPPKYYQLNNGLRYTVTSGSQTHDIELR
jgi:hypothetical protein